MRLPQRCHFSPLFLGLSYRTIIARSGALCRFHSTDSTRLRFVLHQKSSISPSDSRTNLERMESDIDTALITQSTLLPTVSFLVKVHICSTYHTSSIPCLLSLQELVTASHVVVDEWTSSKLWSTGEGPYFHQLAITMRRLSPIPTPPPPPEIFMLMFMFTSCLRLESFRTILQEGTERQRFLVDKEGAEHWKV